MIDHFDKAESRANRKKYIYHRHIEVRNDKERSSELGKFLLQKILIEEPPSTIDSFKKFIS